MPFKISKALYDSLNEHGKQFFCINHNYKTWIEDSTIKFSYMRDVITKDSDALLSWITWGDGFVVLKFDKYPPSSLYDQFVKTYYVLVMKDRLLDPMIWGIQDFLEFVTEVIEDQLMMEQIEQ